MSARLFGVDAVDPATIAGAILMLAMVGALVGLVPARRAAAVDPVTALRAD